MKLALGACDPMKHQNIVPRVYKASLCGILSASLEKYEMAVSMPLFLQDGSCNYSFLHEPCLPLYIEQFLPQNSPRRSHLAGPPGKNPVPTSQPNPQVAHLGVEHAPPMSCDASPESTGLPGSDSSVAVRTNTTVTTRIPDPNVI